LTYVYGGRDEDLPDGYALDVHAEDLGADRAASAAYRRASRRRPCRARRQAPVRLTTTRRPRVENDLAAASTSAGVRATFHGGTGNPWASMSDFASAS